MLKMKSNKRKSHRQEEDKFPHLKKILFSMRRGDPSRGEPVVVMEERESYVDIISLDHCERSLSNEGLRKNGDGSYWAYVLSREDLERKRDLVKRKFREDLVRRRVEVEREIIDLERKIESLESKEEEDVALSLKAILKMTGMI